MSFGWFGWFGWLVIGFRESIRQAQSGFRKSCANFGTLYSFLSLEELMQANNFAPPDWLQGVKLTL